MTTLYELVLAVLLSLQPWKGDKAEIGRADRMATIADAIVTSADDATCFRKSSQECKVVWPGSREQLAATLIAIGWNESHFAAHVHALKCRKGECDEATVLGDGGKPVRIFRARSPWQVHRSSLTSAYWDEIKGDDLASTRAAARAAALLLSGSLARCGSLKGAIAGYATGSSCTWGNAAKRAKQSRDIEEKLRPIRQAR